MRKVVITELLEEMDRFEPEKLFLLAKCPKDTWVRNWQRNETLIDLNKIPRDIHDKILRQFKNMKTADRKKLFDYFVKKKLNKLMQNIGDF